MDRERLTNGAALDIPSQLSSEWFSSDLLETLPAAVYVCNAGGIVVAYTSVLRSYGAALPRRVTATRDIVVPISCSVRTECPCPIVKRRWRLFFEQEHRRGIWKL
jgi:hypothetical protein